MRLPGQPHQSLVTSHWSLAKGGKPHRGFLKKRRSRRLLTHHHAPHGPPPLKRADIRSGQRRYPHHHSPAPPRADFCWCNPLPGSRQAHEMSPDARKREFLNAESPLISSLRTRRPQMRESGCPNFQPGAEDVPRYAKAADFGWGIVQERTCHSQNPLLTK